MKLKIYTVRKARMTGYTGKNRKRKGCIYLKEEMIGKKIVISLVSEYRQVLKQVRKGGTKIKKVQRIVKEMK